MAGDAVVIGSGAAGSVVAWELARAGWSVTVLERGRHLRPGLGEVASHELQTSYGSDEIKAARHLGFPDGRLEPYTLRTQTEARNGVARSAQGQLGQLGAAVGGTSLHYNAKTPRFWRQDFTQLSDLGPVEGAQVADWPISYGDLAPFYDEVERTLGVQGDAALMPDRTRDQTPRSGPFVMPPNPVPYVSSLVGEGARRLGYQPYPQPAAVNSRTYDGRPACNSCGFCSGFGCPINARGDALVSWLNPAVRTGRVRVVDRAFVYRIDTTRKGSRATTVRYADVAGERHAVSGDVVVVAGSPINTARLLLMSRNGAHPDGLGNGSGQVGRNMMFHNQTLAFAIFDHDVHPMRAQSNGLQLDELVGPFTGPEVTALGVPYVKGAMVQVGASTGLVGAATLLAGMVGYGQVHKSLLRSGLLHKHLGGSALWHEDLPQADNRIDLDPTVTDFLGFPSARITYSPHQHEKAAALLLGPRMQVFHQAAPGALAAGFLPNPLLQETPVYSAHLAGTARMGHDPATSVVDADGRMHEVGNVYVADASTFPTFPGFNPTLTIMSNALRIARRITGMPAPLPVATAQGSAS